MNGMFYKPSVVDHFYDHMDILWKDKWYRALDYDGATRTLTVGGTKVKVSSVCEISMGVWEINGKPV